MCTLCMKSRLFNLILFVFLTHSLSRNSMAYGTEYGLVIVDIVQKICLLNIASPDLYGAQDPYARTPRSPKRTETGASRDEQARSPSIDQVCTRLFELYSIFTLLPYWIVYFAVFFLIFYYEFNKKNNNFWFRFEFQRQKWFWLKKFTLFLFTNLLRSIFMKAHKPQICFFI